MRNSTVHKVAAEAATATTNVLKATVPAHTICAQAVWQENAKENIEKLSFKPRRKLMEFNLNARRECTRLHQQTMAY